MPQYASSPIVPELSVVVPVRNEHENIAVLLSEIHAALENITEFEVIYVDDGSDDATPVNLDASITRYPRLRVLRHPRCCGQSAALMSGIHAARGRYIATLDGDGQNDPADIPQLLNIIRAAADQHLLLVTGWRVTRHDTWLRRLSSQVANAIRGYLLKDHTPDTGCGLKVFLRTAFLGLPHFDHMHRFLPALFLRAGGRVQSVPINHRPRQRGTSKYGLHNRLWVGIVDLFGVRWLQTRALMVDVAALNVTDGPGHER